MQIIFGFTTCQWINSLKFLLTWSIQTAFSFWYNGRAYVAQYIVVLVYNKLCIYEPF